MPWLGIRRNGTLSHALPRKFRLGILGIMAAVGTSQVTSAESLRVTDFAVHGSTEHVLREVAEKYRLVIGLYGTMNGTENAIDISVKDGTLADVFDAVVRAGPDLRWNQTESGVIHFVCGTTSLSIFDLTVHSLRITKTKMSELSGNIARVPEVATWLGAHNCEIVEWIVGGRHKPRNEFNLNLGTVRFPTLLDEIAAKSGTYFWYAIHLMIELGVISALTSSISRV